MTSIVVGWAGNKERLSKRWDLAEQIFRNPDICENIASPQDGYLPREEMPEFYRRLDVLLHTSENLDNKPGEAHPLVVYEALACGTPVVMRRGVGDVEFLGAEGVVYYGSEFEIWEKIQYAKARREALGDAGRRWVMKNLSWDKVIHQYLRMFGGMLGTRPRRVVSTVDVPGWCWHQQSQELQKQLYKYNIKMDIVIGRDQKPGQIDWDRYDVIINHVWGYYNKFFTPEFPTWRSVACCNGSLYMREHAKKFIEPQVSLSTVSVPIACDLLRTYPEKYIYYTTRGLDTELFCPD